VVIEKPITSNADQAKELVDIAKSKNLMISAYQNRRWDADFLAVKEILAKNLLGRVVEFESTFSRYRNFIKPGTWKETGELGGGLTYNIGSHLIDQAVRLFGLPEAVYADLGIVRTGGMVDDYFVIRFLRPALAPELKVSLKASYLMRTPEPRFVLHGTLGSFVKYGIDRQEEDLIAGKSPLEQNWGKEDEEFYGWLHTEADGREINTRYEGPAGNYGAFYENIYRHLRLNEALETDASEVLDVIRIIEAAYQSHKEERIIHLR
jgi:predicted dehydrogenase